MHLLNQMRERVNEEYVLWRVAKNRVLPSLDLRGEYWMNGLASSIADYSTLLADLRQAQGRSVYQWQQHNNEILVISRRALAPVCFSTIESARKPGLAPCG